MAQGGRERSSKGVSDRDEKGEREGEKKRPKWRQGGSGHSQNVCALTNEADRHDFEECRETHAYQLFELCRRVHLSTLQEYM